MLEGLAEDLQVGPICRKWHMNSNGGGVIVAVIFLNRKGAKDVSQLNLKFICTLTTSYERVNAKITTGKSEIAKGGDRNKNHTDRT